MRHSAGCAICGFAEDRAIHLPIRLPDGTVRPCIHPFTPKDDEGDFPVSDRWVIYCMECCWATYEDTHYLGKRLKSHLGATGCKGCLAVFQDNSAVPMEVRHALKQKFQPVASGEGQKEEK